jgi:hypothetical protein
MFSMKEVRCDTEGLFVADGCLVSLRGEGIGLPLLFRLRACRFGRCNLLVGDVEEDGGELDIG